MAFATMQFGAPALNKGAAMNIILPEGADGPYPVLYLLHGLSDDHSIWSRRTAIERHVMGIPLIVVMPDTHRCFYTDMVDGFAYEQHIVEDVVGFVDRTFNTIASRDGRVLSGNSMGGYGSIKLGLKHTDKFCSISAHSSVIQPWNLSSDEKYRNELRRIFGDNADGSDSDPHQLIKDTKKSDLPRLRFDCGVDDRLLKQNQGFHTFLESQGVEHVYEEYPGEHNWAYWDDHIRQSIRFHCESLGIEV